MYVNMIAIIRYNCSHACDIKMNLFADFVFFTSQYRSQCQ